MNRSQLYASTTIAALAAFGVVEAIPATVSQTGSYGVCWGYQTNQFAQTGTLGQHASSFPTPRTGLGNLMQQSTNGFQGLVQTLTGESCFQ